MGYKMKGAPMYDTSSKHGTNKNYQMSGMTKDGAPFLGGVLGGIKKTAGNFLKGKGVFGALNPIGAIANRMGAFGNRGGQAPPPSQPAAQMNTQMAAAAPAPAGAVDPSAPPVDPNTMDPNATNA